MSNLIIEKLLAKQKRTDLPEFAPGDTIRVHVRIREGDKERVQAFEGCGPRASHRRGGGDEVVSSLLQAHSALRLRPPISVKQRGGRFAVRPRVSCASEDALA